MALSPNYGWAEPDNSSLVKNGAQDIRALGDAIDTSLWNVGYGQAGKNALINGGLDIWQRGTTYTGTGNTWITADRWYMLSSTSSTFAQETTVIPSGCQYSMKMTAGASASSFQGYQSIETLNSVAFAGSNATLSMNFQASVSTAMSITLEYSTTVDKALATGGWVPITATTGGTGNATTGSFATISGTYAIPSTAKSLRVSFATVSTMASGAILYWGKSQLEYGSKVTPFDRNASTIQGELAACQRYYQKSYAQGTAVPTNSTLAGSQSLANVSVADQAFIGYQYLPVVMRIAPTVTIYSYTSSTAARVSNGNGTDLAANSGLAGGIADRGYYVYNGSGSSISAANGGYLFHYQASAEL